MDTLIIVICIACSNFIYKLDYVPVCSSYIDVDMFIPYDDAIATPKEGDLMLCPKCGNNFCDNYGNCSCGLLTNKGILPKCCRRE